MFLVFNIGEKWGQPGYDLPTLFFVFSLCVAPFQLIAWLNGLYMTHKERRNSGSDYSDSEVLYFFGGSWLFWLIAVIVIGFSILFAPFIITGAFDAIFGWLGNYLPIIGTKVEVLPGNSFCVPTILFLAVPPIFSVIRLITYDMEISRIKTNVGIDELSRMCLILSGSDASSFQKDDLAAAQSLLIACKNDVNNLARWNVVGQSISVMRDDTPLNLTEEQRELFEKSRARLRATSN